MSDSQNIVSDGAASDSDDWGVAASDYSQHKAAAKDKLDTSQFKFILVCAQELDSVTKTILIPYDLLPDNMQLAWQRLMAQKQTVNGVADVVIVNMLTHDETTIDIGSNEVVDDTNIDNNNNNNNDNVADNSIGETARHVWQEFANEQLKTDYRLFVPWYQHHSYSYSSLKDPDTVHWQDLTKYDLLTAVGRAGSFDDLANYQALLAHYQPAESVLFLKSVDGQLQQQQYANQDEEEAAFTAKKRSYSDYYLYCQQSCNFQTRTLLIPALLLSEQRLADWQEIKSHCLPAERAAQLLTAIGGQTAIELASQHNLLSGQFNVAVINIVWQDRTGSRDPKHKRLSQLCGLFEGVADDGRYFGRCERHYGDYYDIDWQTYSYNSLCGGFNHLLNYCQLLTMSEYDEHPINIVDSLLILEADGGRLSAPSYDTVDEMMFDIYFKPLLQQTATEY